MSVNSHTNRAIPWWELWSTRAEYSYGEIYGLSEKETLFCLNLFLTNWMQILFSTCENEMTQLTMHLMGLYGPEIHYDWQTRRPGVSTVPAVSLRFWCASFLFLYSPAKVIFLELLELLLCKQRLWLLGLLGWLVRAIPGLSPWIVAQDLSETESE